MTSSASSNFALKHKKNPSWRVVLTVCFIEWLAVCFHFFTDPILPFLCYINLSPHNGLDCDAKFELTFPRGLWNDCQWTRDNMPRKNNSGEGFHIAMQSSFTNMHPSFWKQIHVKEEILVKVEEVQCWTRSQIHKRKEMCNSMAKRLWRQVHRYNPLNKISYLHSGTMNLYIF